MNNKYSEVVQTARDYYNSDDAENFYSSIWGGEDIHIGMYNDENEPIFDASRRTVEKMISYLKEANQDSRVLDLGSGYGGSARYLAKKLNCHVDCLNLSEAQNERNRKMNIDQSLGGFVSVIDGSFEDIPFNEGSFNIAWSQDAILHSGKREKVIDETSRVLKKGGEFIFTDIMQSDDCPEGVLQPILDRIHLATLGSPEFYRETCSSHGMEEITFIDMSEHLPTHYSRVLEEIDNNMEKICEVCTEEYITNMKKGLQHWIDGGKKGYLKWGIFHFTKR